MKNLFLPYELSVIAKEKGFDEPVMGYYKFITSEYLPKLILDHNGEQNYFLKRHNSKIDSVTNEIDIYIHSAPIYQQIIDWFRVEHNILLTPLACGGNKTVIGYKWFIQKGMEDTSYSRETNKCSEYYEGLKEAIHEAFRII